jgi:WD40 repeat protein
MSRTLPTLAALLLLARCLAPAPASAADAPPADTPRPLAKLAGPAGTAVEFSRDGKLILTAGGDEVRVWNAHTFEPITEPLKHEARLLMACLSPDASRVLTCSGPQALLWDARTGRRLLSLKHPAEVRCVSFSADGSKLVTGSEDGVARVWDATGGAALTSFTHDAPVQWARLLPDGRMLITLTARTKRDPADHRESGADVHGWDATDGQKWYTGWSTASVFSKSHGRWVMPLDVSPDGRLCAKAFTWLAILSNTDDGSATDSVDTRAGPDGDGRPWPGWPHAALFSPDGRRVAFASATGVAIVDVVKAESDGVKFGNETFNVGRGDVETMAFSPDGKRLILGGSDGGSGVWDVDAGRLLIGSRAHPKGESPAVAFSPDGRRIAAGFASDGYTAVWEVPEGRER